MPLSILLGSELGLELDLGVRFRGIFRDRFTARIKVKGWDVAVLGLVN
jgi:hypothetical protein